MEVRVTKRAQAQIDRAALWWDQNRPLAPEAFDKELAEAFSLLSVEPGIGPPVSNTRTLYYRVRRGQVEVLSLWHTSRGAGPSV